MRYTLLLGAYLFGIIILGYLLKRWHILTKKDGDVLSRMIVYVTLPAAIIVN
ncbi:AEC family transporter [Enterococcus cecorum]|nr:AEC family transporter [Enterococcus cecorum]